MSIFTASEDGFDPIPDLETLSSHKLLSYTLVKRISEEQTGRMREGDGGIGFARGDGTGAGEVGGGGNGRATCSELWNF